jgi:hypothetical protein
MVMLSYALRAIHPEYLDVDRPCICLWATCKLLPHGTDKHGGLQNELARPSEGLWT